MFWPRNEFLLLPPPTLPISSLNDGAGDGDDGDDGEGDVDGDEDIDGEEDKGCSVSDDVCDTMSQ